jgi:uncharacterized protein with HEPN domain
MRHMLDYAREAVAMVSGRRRADLDEDRMLQLALVHVIEMIGEAANRVSPPGRHPDVPWTAAIGARNRMIHGYDSIDYDVVWQIATEDLPALIQTLERLLPGHRS